MYSNAHLAADIWGEIRPYRGKFILATILRVVGEIAYLYPVYAFAIIVDFFSGYAPGADLAPLYREFFLTIGAFVVVYLAYYFSTASVARIAERSSLDIESDAMEHMLLLDMSWHEKENAGSKLKRIERGAAGIEKILMVWIQDIVYVGISMVGVLTIMANVDRTVALALIAFFITYYALSRAYRTQALKFVNIVNVKEEDRSGSTFEAINNVRSIKVMSMRQTVMESLRNKADSVFESVKQRIYWFRSGNNMRHFYAHLFRIGVLLFIAKGITEGAYTVGFFILFNGYFSNAWQAISRFSEAGEEISVARNSVARMKEILDIPVTIDDEAGKVPFPSDWKSIAFENISFSYGEKPTLTDISFKVGRGEKVGIVGLSGAGKSTIFKLLLKENDMYAGAIRFDEVSLKDISKENYFEHVAVVLQDTELFNASLENNITITNRKEAGNKTLLENAVRIAHVKDFMEKMPKGMSTMIGEKGIKLSGGEKQRVGIARAIFKKPQIFLLDEATSHLDIESEEKIRDSLHSFFGGVTAIVIAHRLTTIKEMDRIIALENGAIIESGSFAELQAKKGRFFELWEKQKL